MRATPAHAARPPARPLLVAPCLVCALALSGCGDEEPRVTPSTVTVTAQPTSATDAEVTVEPTAGAAEGTAPPSQEASAEPSVDLAALPRQDRGHDVALVDGASEVGGGTVLSIDRLTVVGLDDAVLAREGTELFVDEGDRFANQTVRLYEVGVRPDARFFLTTCTRDGSGQPVISSGPVDLAAFLAAPGLAGTAVTFLYEDGLVARGETNPRC